MAKILSDDATKAGVSFLLFHCIFNGDGSITHFMHDIDLESYQSLPNMYAVCIAERAGKQRKVTGGFFIRTSYTHDDKDFDNALAIAAAGVPRLDKLITKDSSFLPARVQTPAGPPLTEKEMLKAMLSQQLKHSSMGMA
jgi:hypothetical protein